MSWSIVAGEDEAKAANVAVRIDALGSSPSAEAVRAARAAYAALTAEQQALVPSETLAKLVAAEKALATEKQQDSSSPEKKDTKTEGNVPSDTKNAAKTDTVKKALKKSFTVNVKNVTASAVARAAKKAGSDAKSATSITLGSKVKAVKKGVFKKCGSAKTLVVKTRKLTKKGVRDALAGSKIKTVRVKVGSKAQNKKYAKKYKEIFAKKTCGKKVTVK